MLWAECLCYPCQCGDSGTPWLPGMLFFAIVAIITYEVAALYVEYRKRD